MGDKSRVKVEFFGACTTVSKLAVRISRDAVEILNRCNDHLWLFMFNYDDWFITCNIINLKPLHAYSFILCNEVSGRKIRYNPHLAPQAIASGP